MPRILFYSVIAALFLVGIGLMWGRHAKTHIPLLPGEQAEVWLVEAKINFTALGDAVRVSLDIPDNLPGFKMFNEQTASPGYGFSVDDVGGGNRRAVWTIRHATGAQTLYYKVQVTPEAYSAMNWVSPPRAPLEVFWDESQQGAARHVLEQAHARSDSLLTMCRELIKLVNAVDRDQNVSLLLSSMAVDVLLEKLFNYAGIPTRIAKGLHLEENRHNLKLDPVLVVYDGAQWVMFDPLTGRQGLPDNFMLWNQDDSSLLDVSGGEGSRVSFAITHQTVSAKQLAIDALPQTPFSFFDMHKLPVEEQNMLKVMLLIPLGALVVVFVNIIVGVRTSGTFMPILIALSFLQTALVPGVISFVAIVSFGLLLRSYLSHFNLLLVARISTIVILVLMVIVFTSLFGYRVGFNTGMTVTFFPVIIIAWTIERMSILWEDEGPREVVLQGGGSLLVAVCAYLMMSWPVAVHLSFNYPEINLIILALIMTMGNYTGYKWTELRRFRALRLKLRL